LDLGKFFDRLIYLISLATDKFYWSFIDFSN